MIGELAIYRGELGPSVIAIDADDVLYHTARGMLKYHFEVRNFRVPLESFYTGEPSVWGVSSVEEALAVSEAYMREGDFFATLPEVGTKAGVLDLKSDGHRLHVVTGRPRWSREQTQQALDRDFPGCFEDVHCTGYLNENKEPKHIICERIGARGLVDDYWGHSVGLKGLFVLFGRHPWQRFAPQDTARALTWGAVRRHFNPLVGTRQKRHEV